MTLEEWIKKENINYAKCAKLFGMDSKNPACNIMRYAKGDRIPHYKIMKIIFEKTNQQVQPNDFYENIWKK
jgi:hypothetical protein